MITLTQYVWSKPRMALKQTNKKKASKYVFVWLRTATQPGDVRSSDV